MRNAVSCVLNPVTASLLSIPLPPIADSTTSSMSVKLQLVDPRVRNIVDAILPKSFELLAQVDPCPRGHVHSVAVNYGSQEWHNIGVAVIEVCHACLVLAAIRAHENIVL